MVEFRIDSLGQLARQMQFTPQGPRLAQLSAAEALIHEIDTSKAYPLEFIIYRITGYRPKRAGQDLLTGLALQHDLGLLIERVSDSLNLDPQQADEPVLSIDDLAARFDVATKTIQRWRRRGLPARRYCCADGRRRLGFLLSSVEQFMQRQAGQGEGRLDVSPADRDEVKAIVRRAGRLIGSGLCPEEACRRIGRRANRSPFAVLQLLRRHDVARPSAAVLAGAPAPLSPRERRWVVKQHRRGVALGRLAQRLGRPRAELYRAIIEQRVERLNRQRIRYIDDPLYHQPEAAQIINDIVAQQPIEDAPSADQTRVPPGLPPYFQSLYRVPLLSAARERALFLQYNFHKYHFVQARRRIRPEYCRRRDLCVLEQHLASATEVRNAIVQANLRLVVSIARRHVRPGLDLMELVSEGNIVLMRAVEGFDLHLGNRFSTYATLALMKGFARVVPQMQSRQRLVSVEPERLGDMEDVRPADRLARLFDREEARSLLSRLSAQERQVLSAHYGLGRRQPATLEQVSQRLGLTRPRVRRIEQQALAKLRSAVGGHDTR